MAVSMLPKRLNVSYLLTSSLSANAMGVLGRLTSCYLPTPPAVRQAIRRKAGVHAAVALRFQEMLMQA